MPGTELALQLRLLAPQLAIIFATGQPMVEGFEQDARALVLHKPYGARMLDELLGRLFARQ